jgi:hypothetical protein
MRIDTSNSAVETPAGVPAPGEANTPLATMAEIISPPPPNSSSSTQPDAEVATTSESLPRTSDPQAPTEQRAGLAIPGVLAKVKRLSEAEQASYFACQEVVRMGWNSFVDVGLALSQIREERLYREEYGTFEQYCRSRWDYGRRYVNQMISAAQLFRFLGANCSQTKPDHESQVRPLIGLTPEQTKSVWESAVQKARGRRVTGAVVKKAVKDLQGAGNPEPVQRPKRPSKAEQRRIIGDAVGQLLMLASQKAAYDVLTKKIEELHGHIQTLFA